MLAVVMTSWGRPIGGSPPGTVPRTVIPLAAKSRA